MKTYNFPKGTVTIHNEPTVDLKRAAEEFMQKVRREGYEEGEIETAS